MIALRFFRLPCCTRRFNSDVALYWPSRTSAGSSVAPGNSHVDQIGAYCQTSTLIRNGSGCIAQVLLSVRLCI